jgi:hypothetical protein
MCSYELPRSITEYLNLICVTFAHDFSIIGWNNHVIACSQWQYLCTPGTWQNCYAWSNHAQVSWEDHKQLHCSLIFFKVRSTLLFILSCSACQLWQHKLLLKNQGFVWLLIDFIGSWSWSRKALDRLCDIFWWMSRTYSLKFRVISTMPRLLSLVRINKHWGYSTSVMPQNVDLPAE